MLVFGLSFVSQNEMQYQLLEAKEHCIVGHVSVFCERSFSKMVVGSGREVKCHRTGSLLISKCFTSQEMFFFFSRIFRLSLTAFFSGLNFKVVSREEGCGRQPKYTGEKFLEK